MNTHTFILLFFSRYVQLSTTCENIYFNVYVEKTTYFEASECRETNSDIDNRPNMTLYSHTCTLHRQHT